MMSVHLERTEVDLTFLYASSKPFLFRWDFVEGSTHRVLDLPIEKPTLASLCLVSVQEYESVHEMRR